MDEPLRKLATDDANVDDPNKEDSFDLDDLLHPAQAFSHPSDAVSYTHLTLPTNREV